MTFSTPHVLLTCEGNLSATGQTDIWRATFKFPVTLGSIPSSAQLASFLDAVDGNVAAFHGSPNVFAGASAVLSSLSAAVIGTDGKYLGGGSQETIRQVYTPGVAGNGTTIAPWSQAMVLTLRTAKPRGAAAYGRAYWPATALSCDPDGRVSVSIATTYATRAQTMLDAFNAAAAANGFGAGGRVSVCSAVGAGQNLPVVKVGIGRKVDRQERRENNLNEDHIYLNLAGAALLLQEARDSGVLFGG